MSRRLVVGSAAELEIAQAADWYSQRNPAVGLGFLRTLDEAIDIIRQRRALVDGYPYALFYMLSETEIFIVSCFHASRDPKIWRERIR